jgi:CheY-like chemotaxis protein
MVTEVLGLSYSQGNRRLTTSATWALEELQLLAEHFGETLDQLIAGAGSDDLLDAVLLVGSSRVPCRVLRGQTVRKPRLTPGDAGWMVLPASPDLATPAFDVLRLVAEPASAMNRRIAVLDDHDESAELIVSYLKTAGFDPVAFTRLEHIAAALASSDFDGYVLDWIIVNDTVRSLVADIRTRDAHGPIVVLTGQMRSGIADESDIATAMTQYRLRFFEKPASLPIIAAALLSSFGAA